MLFRAPSQLQIDSKYIPTLHGAAAAAPLLCSGSVGLAKLRRVCSPPVSGGIFNRRYWDFCIGADNTTTGKHDVRFELCDHRWVERHVCALVELRFRKLQRYPSLGQAGPQIRLWKVVSVHRTAVRRWILWWVHRRNIGAKKRRLCCKRIRWFDLIVFVDSQGLTAISGPVAQRLEQGTHKEFSAFPATPTHITTCALIATSART
jgi:hypothetical protein